MAIPPAGEPAELPSEILKLLLQVSWADGVVQPEERSLIERLGQRWGVSLTELNELLSRLDQGEPLPPPNLEMLRSHRRAVDSAVRSLVEADGVTSEEEQEMVEQIQQLLSGR